VAAIARAYFLAFKLMFEAPQSHLNSCFVPKVGVIESIALQDVQEN